MVNSVSISGRTNIRQMTSSARIVLKNLQPGIAYNAFWPDAALKIQDADTDLTIDLTMDNAGKIKLDYHLPYHKLSWCRPAKR